VQGPGANREVTGHSAHSAAAGWQQLKRHRRRREKSDKPREACGRRDRTRPAARVWWP